MKSFWYYFFGTVLFPHRAFRRLSDEPAPLLKGFKAILLIGLLYTLTVVGFAVTGAVPMVPIWLSVPAHNYYFWEIFFALPVVLLGWILAAGVVQLLGQIGKAKGAGSFEKSLAALGFAATLPCFVIWIPETWAVILMLLGMSQEELVEILSTPGFWQTFAVFYQIVAVLWMFVLFSLAVHAVQKLRLLRTLWISLVAVAIFMLMMITIIR
jgi:hypothetical protein